MKKFQLKTMAVGLAAGLGLLFLGAAPASADTGPQSSTSSAQGNGVIAGNSAALNIAIPVTIKCNANGVGIFGGGGGFSVCGDGGLDTGPQQNALSAQGSGVGTGNTLGANLATPIDVKCNGNGIGGAGIGIGGSLCDLWG